MQKVKWKICKILAINFMVKQLHLRNKIYCDTLLFSKRNEFCKRKSNVTKGHRNLTSIISTMECFIYEKKKKCANGTKATT